MSEAAAVMTYRQRPLTVTAIQWEPELGEGHGVRARPKKHESNPDEWYVRDRFGKETILEAGQWVLTYPDGSNAIVPEGTFQTLYEQDVAEPGGRQAATGSQDAPAEVESTIASPTVQGGGEEAGAASGASQVANPAAEGEPD